MKLSSEVIIYYLDPETGQTYAEIGGHIFELEIGDDVTEEIECKDLETLRVYDSVAEKEEPGTLRVEEAL